MAIGKTLKNMFTGDQARRAELIEQLEAERRANAKELQQLRDERDAAYEVLTSPERRYRAAIVAHSQALERGRRREAAIEAELAAVKLPVLLRRYLAELDGLAAVAAGEQSALKFVAGPATDQHHVRLAVKVEALHGARKAAEALGRVILDDIELEARIADIRSQFQAAVDAGEERVQAAIDAETRQRNTRRGFGLEV
ncbi:MAG: hypothetical protein AB7R89_16305 [Dehalococcoidia bacterium]